MHEDFQMAWARDNPTTRCRQFVKWKAPNNPFVKVNWDAALCNTTQKMGIGIAMRDHCGQFLAGLSSSLDFSSKPILVEFKALWRALELCVELGLERVYLEGDAQTLIHSINGGDTSQAWRGNIIEEVQQILKNVPFWSINFVHRERNKVVHLLDKNGLLLSSESIWIKDIPIVIKQVVIDELSINE